MRRETLKQAKILAIRKGNNLTNKITSPLNKDLIIKSKMLNILMRILLMMNNLTIDNPNLNQKILRITNQMMNQRNL